MEQFCGSVLWDNTIWNSTIPHLTICFQETILVWTPSAFMWLFVIIEIIKLYNSKCDAIPWTIISRCKMIATFMLCILSLCDAMYALTKLIYHNCMHRLWLHTPIIKLITFALVALIQWFHRKKGIHTSGVLFTFWLLYLLTAVINVYTIIMKSLGNYDDDLSRIEGFTAVTMIINVPIVVTQFVLNCFSDASGDVKIKNECPEDRASFISQMTFWWFNKLVIKGFKKSLIQEDIWSLSDKNRSDKIVEKFDRNWDRTKRSSHDRINIIWPIIRTFWVSFLWAALIKFIPSCLTFVNPIILNWLIIYMNFGNYGTNTEPFWHGIAYAALMLVSSSFESLLNSQYDYHIFSIAMRIRSCIISIIYRKVLKLSPTGRKDFTTGEIVNLMSVDTQRVMEYIQIANLLWICPLQISISMYLLWQHLQYGSIAGLTVMLLLLPLNGYIGAKMRRQQIMLLKQRDRRIKLMNEILSGIKVLKLYAWEPSFVSLISQFRQNEMKSLKRQAYLSAGITFAFNSAPFFVAIVSFATFTLINSNNVLDAQKAFVSLSIFNILRRPLAFFPQLITSTMMFLVSIKRINKYLNSDEIDSKETDEKSVKNNNIETKEISISLSNASFTWNKDDYLSTKNCPLSNITLKVNTGQLIAIVGHVGSGKSSLLSAILNEMHRISGHIHCWGSIAYVPQQSWIQNATVRGNILFGREYNKEYYKNVISSCALEPDLKILTAGDDTEIGEKGINLSGGQKQRISLARAVYSDRDIYLFDDPLSAVDSHVGKHIFDHVIGPKGMLKTKTRILVTHRVSVLPHVTSIVVLKNGRISEYGSYSELINKKGEFAEFLAEYFTNGPEELIEEDEYEVIEEMATQIMPHIERRLSRMTSIKSDTSLRRRFSVRSYSEVEDNAEQIQKNEQINLDNNSIDSGSKLISTEKLETGTVSWSVYCDYVKAIGTAGAIITVLSYIAANCFTVGTSVWLSEWSNDASIKKCRLSRNLTHTEVSRNLRLGVYAALGTGQTIFILIATVTLSLASLKGSSFLHNHMLDNIIHAPMSFFDTTPIGRILNRFSKDIDTTDVTLLISLRLLIIEFFRAFATIAIISIGTPMVLVSFVPLGFFYYGIQKFYISSSRQLKRLESASRSPIYSHFSETITGAASIRAYRVTTRFVNESNEKVDKNHGSYYASIVSSRWLAIRLEFLGNCVVFLTALFAVYSRGSLTPGNAGLSVSYALTITATLNLLVRGSTDLETNIVSVERIREYTRISREADWHSDYQLDPLWPSKGSIGFCHYSTRYRSGLDLILKHVSFQITSGHRVGIVGRTGAGKSSLTLALFRLIEPTEGSICIDGVCITSLGLHELRSRLTIIPQEPVLFTGSLRLNLDPFGQYNDDKIWTSLELAHLKPFVLTLDSGLDYQITESGDNLSVGQKQLVCLTRALLKKSKILILDEATAAVDLETDELIQRTIRKEFNGCTIVTIAHRLNTVLDYDMIIVMNDGQIAEYDSPHALLNNPESLFYSMAKDSGNIQ